MPAKLAGLLFDDLEAPAHPFGIALIHPQQVAGEQRRLVAPGAGPDFQDRGARIGRVLRQKRQPQAVLPFPGCGPSARGISSSASAFISGSASIASASARSSSAWR